MTHPPLAPNSRIEISGGGTPLLFVDGHCITEPQTIAAVAEVEWANLVRQRVALMTAVDKKTTPQNTDKVCRLVDRISQSIDRRLGYAQAWNAWGEENGSADNAGNGE